MLKKSEDIRKKIRSRKNDEEIWWYLKKLEKDHADTRMLKEFEEF